MAGVKRLGHLPVDLSHLQQPSKRKSRGSTTYIPEIENQIGEIKVQIGQVIKDFLTVEFAARVGRQTVGLASFEYEAIANGEDSDESDKDDPNYWLHQPFNAE